MAFATQSVAFTIKDGRIMSSSGLARDVNAALYWTANKTGDGGVVYGLTTTGAVRGTLNYRTKPVDVEGLAVVNDTLYVGDIGDRTPAVASSRSTASTTLGLRVSRSPTAPTTSHSATDPRTPRRCW